MRVICKILGGNAMKALRNILRMPVRSLILTSVFLVLSFALTVLLAVYGITADNIGSVIGPLGDCVKVTNTLGDVPIELHDAEYIAENYGIITDLHAHTDNLCNIPSIKHVEVENADNMGGFEAFTVTAVTSTDIIKKFYSGDRAIVSGSGITSDINKENKLMAVISKELAELNSLSLGDRLDLKISTRHAPEPIDCTLYIGGIYEDAIKYAPDAAYPYQIPENEIYMPISVYGKIMLTPSLTDITLDGLYFELKDNSDATVEALQKSLRSINGYNTGNVLLSSFSPESEAATLSRLSGSVDIAIIAIIICFAVSFCAVALWNLQSRTREIGTYCILGIKRRRVARSLCREMLILLSVALIIALLLCLILSASFGKDLFAFLSFGSLSDAGETTVEGVLYNESATNAGEEMLKDGRYLIVNYLLPAFGKALLICLPLILAVHLASCVMIKRLDIMRTMGGNAQ